MPRSNQPPFLSRAVASVASLALVSGAVVTIAGCADDEPPQRVYRVERPAPYYPPPPREVVVQQRPAPYGPSDGYAPPATYDEGRYDNGPYDNRQYDNGQYDNGQYANAPVDAPAYEPPPLEVVTAYQSDLSPYGQWVDVPQYGRCWRPAGRPAGWRPYTVGHWVDTDAGWAWVAEGDEANWGYATYHYGRWYESPSTGWVWVPGTTYSPAWVSWREGGGYCGWAPLPPEVPIYGASTVIIDRYVPADRYTFVEERYITSPHVYERVIVRDRPVIIRKTVNITKITYVNNRVVNPGVPVRDVERYTGHRVERVQPVRVTTADEARRLRTEGRPVVYEPPVIQKAESHRAEVHQQRIAQQQQVHAQRQQQELQAKQQKQNEQLQKFQQKQGIRQQEHTQDLQEQQQKFQAKEQKQQFQQQTHENKVLQRDQEHLADQQQQQQKEQQRLQAERDAQAQHAREQQISAQRRAEQQQQEAQARQQKQAAEQQQHDQRVQERQQKVQEHEQAPRQQPQEQPHQQRVQERPREIPQQHEQQQQQQQQKVQQHTPPHQSPQQEPRGRSGEKSRGGQTEGTVQNQVR